MTTRTQALMSLFWLSVSLSMMIVLIRRKRAGLWKRPRTFPIAMTLLGLAAVLSTAALVLRQFGL
jgi:hypothetical protein